ncbi:hypothetical protein LCGC14_1195440 [marine sediment metagenome]|uniref:J domain-containing protein n=1 Tax=marine sediment metagenome TaxID=412755 RepID=A0A0F9PNG4_9ZZZZ
MSRVTAVDQSRRDIRHAFAMWDIDPSEFEILWEEERGGRGQIMKRPGAIVRYLRNSQWQTISCYGFPSRPENLRQCYLLLNRLRIAEQHGVQYEGLSHSTEVAAPDTASARRESILDAYDTLGAGPEDPLELIKDIYRRKSMYYHPDKGGDAEKFKRLTAAYELIMKSRGEK